MDTYIGWLIRYLNGQGYLEEMVVCEACLDTDLVVHKRRAIPGTCDICGVGTH